MTTYTDTGKKKLVINRATKTQFDAAQNLADNELYLIDPEFNGNKVLGTDANGEIVETTLPTSSLISDIQINGSTIVSSGVANIPKAAQNILGVSSINSTAGIAISSSGGLYINKATDAEIETKTNTYKPLVPANLDKAVAEGISNNSITLTETQKKKARTW